MSNTFVVSVVTSTVTEKVAVVPVTGVPSFSVHDVIAQSVINSMFDTSSSLLLSMSYTSYKCVRAYRHQNTYVMFYML